MFFYFTLFTSGCGNNMPKSTRGNLAWDVESVTFYKVHEFSEIDKLGEEKLSSLVSVKVKDSRLTSLFKEASFNDKSALWKGGHLETVDLRNGENVRIYISNYGNFFVIHGQRGYYFFENPEDQKLWDYLFFGEGLKKYLKESSE